MTDPDPDASADALDDDALDDDALDDDALDEDARDAAGGDAALSDAALSDADVRDELPADLDASAFRVDYTFPNNSRRRVPAAMYIVLGTAAAAAYLIWKDSSPLVNRGLMIAGIALAVFGLYGMVAGRRLRIDETEALGSATRTIGFAVGHASAQLAWRGLWSLPVWRLLLYSAETPPTRRAMVIVDGITGEVLQWFSEDNPEQWGDDVPLAVRGGSSG